MLQEPSSTTLLSRTHMVCIPLTVALIFHSDVWQKKGSQALALSGWGDEQGYYGVGLYDIKTRFCAK
jgi:hypothetical protein